jgi:outer membrane protein assembly factor BamB
VLHSRNVADLNQFNFMGTPIVTPDVVYVAALKTNSGTELHALALQASDGKLLWSTHLGTHQMDQNQMYYQRSCQPALLLERDRLYVDTHAGALIQLDVASGAVTWAVNYDSHVQDGNRYNYSSEFLTTGRPQMAGGQLFFKGMRSPRLVSVNPDLPAVVWNRPVAESANLVGLDDDRVYLGGEDITAFDRKTKKLLWSNRLPLGSTFATPVLTRNRLYQFTPRGIYELDKATGRQLALYRGADLESMGGRLLLAPHLLIAVSNLSITAYPLGESSASASPVAGASSPPAATP